MPTYYKPSTIYPMMKYCTIIILCLFSQVAGADVFSPPPADKSVEFLGMIFGSNIGLLYLGGEFNPVLSKLFELLNVVIVTLGTIIVSYIGIVSTVNTAQEGKAMGKKWSSIWIPMRSILGMALMVPSFSSGYSIVQIAVMWIIMQGIGAADKIWNVVLEDLGQGISSNTANYATNPNSNSIEISILNQNAHALAEQTLKSAICMVSMQQLSKGAYVYGANQSKSRIPKSYFADIYGKRISVHSSNATISPSNITKTTNAVTKSGTVYVGVKGHSEYNNICGQYNVSGTAYLGDFSNVNSVSAAKLKTKAQLIFNQKQQAIAMMINNYKPLAKLIIAQMIHPRSKPYGGKLIANSKHPPEPGGFKQQAVDIYVHMLRSLVKPTEAKSWVRDAIRKGKKSGWVSAGSFYFVLNQSQNSQLLYDVTHSKPRASNLPNAKQLKKLSMYLDNIEERQFLLANLQEAQLYFNSDVTENNTKLNIASAKYNMATETDNFSKNLWTLQSSMVEWLAEQMSNTSGDPIMAQAQFGARIMFGSEITWVVLMQLSGALVAMGTSNMSEKVYQTTMYTLFFAGAVAIAIVSIIWVAGATLAIYVPLIPYMMFTVGVLGWFLLVVEAVVAAPIMTLGFILPTNEELGKIQHGLLLIANITLRPSLMLFGFILAARVYRAVIALVNFGLVDNFKTLDTSASMLAWIPSMILYAVFIMALANKCFALIYALPDKILRWIGGPPEHTDANQELQQAKSGLHKGGDAAQKPASGFAIGRFAQVKDQLSNQLADADDTATKSEILPKEVPEKNAEPAAEAKTTEETS